jgi:hypothetical protein
MLLPPPPPAKRTKIKPNKKKAYLKNQTTWNNISRRQVLFYAVIMHNGWKVSELLSGLSQIHKRVV